MGFTKLDERIVQSSIMAESPETFKVWITLLALCKEDGVAECSALFLESVCRIPLDKIKIALTILSKPDDLSRSLNDDGRRIERVDGGYKIINYVKYRSESLRSAEAERKRLYRENKKCPDMSGQCPDTSASASSSFSFSEKKEEVQEKETKDVISVPSHLSEIWPEFLLVRKAKKAINSARAIRSILNELSRLSEVPEQQIKIIEQSVRNSWKDVYPLRENYQQKQSKGFDKEAYLKEQEEWIKNG